MAKNILFYKTLNKDLLEKLDCRIECFNASYSTRGEQVTLKCNYEEDGGVQYLSIVDDTGRWSPDEYNLILDGTLVLTDTNVLFGRDGVVPDGGTLGIGVVWKSKTSGYRSAKAIHVVESCSGMQEYPFSVEFEAASVRGSIELVFQLYLKNSGNNSPLPSGVSLGDVYRTNIILEGINSTFTVFEKSAPGEPLWTVVCDWDDPEYDSFSEHVRVTINTAHPAWNFTTDDDVRKELLKEIMASSMQVVISELKGEYIDLAEEYVSGSVCDAIAYITSRAHLETDSPCSIARSIRAYLDKTMK